MAYTTYSSSIKLTTSHYNWINAGWSEFRPRTKKTEAEELRPVVRTNYGWNVAVGDGYRIKTPSMEHLEKHGLLEKGLLHFTNELCSVFDNKGDELPENEWTTLDKVIRNLMVGNEEGGLYYHLLETYGAEALNFNSWYHFSRDMSYGICLQTFTDMPTEMLIAYGQTSWKGRIGTLGEVGINHVMERIGAREDEYGNMPSSLAYGLLFE